MATDQRRLGRNDLCTCGSGRKFKKCCGAVDLAAEDASSRFFGIAAIAAGLMLVAGLAMGIGSMISGGSDGPKKVWSAEHGHYHTVGGGEPGQQGGFAEGGPGKVWNEAHGHYHDVAKGTGGADLEAETPIEGALDGLRESELDAARRKAASLPPAE